MLPVPPCSHCPHVPPLAGGWIEMVEEQIYKALERGVPPLAGGWIEIPNVIKF